MTKSHGLDLESHRALGAWLQQTDAELVTWQECLAEAHYPGGAAFRHMKHARLVLNEARFHLVQALCRDYPEATAAEFYPENGPTVEVCD